MHIHTGHQVHHRCPLKTEPASAPAVKAESTPIQDGFSAAIENPVLPSLGLLKQTMQPPASVTASVPTTTPLEESVGPAFDPSNLDRTTSPTADFYQFAMGGYLSRKPIPADRARFGVDTEITMRNEATVHQILQELAQQTNPAGTIEQKLGDYFKSGMDIEGIERKGLSPLQADFASIEAVSNRTQLSEVVGRFHSEGNGVYFGFYGTADTENASRVIGEFHQDGLSLPEPEYYLEPENQETLGKFQAHVSRMFQLAGETPEQADAHAQGVINLETKLARISLSRAEMRDPEALVNKKTPQQLQELSSAFDWGSYLRSQKADGQSTYNVTVPKFFQGLDQVLSETSLDDHKAYLRWHLLSGNASQLPQAFDAESFDFWGKTMKGLTEQQPRVNRIADAADNDLGEALGVKFVERRFSPEAKTKMLGMVDAFKDALTEKVMQQPWMSRETKIGALQKIATFKAKIGYPDNPQNYAELPITDSYIDNTRAAARYRRDRNMAEIGKPTDREAWGMSAATNNAYYNPTTNEICFPAGILQPPYFDVNADDAMNFGGIGATIGHEMGHGFDDEGAQFDASGNLRNWFAPDDLEKFKEKSGGVERQFSEYVVEGLPVNGKLVLGEALADLSGLELAYAAFKKASAGTTPEMIDGFTPDQRFFLSFAQSWATNVRPEYAKYMIKTDPHPLPKLRVNGTVSNMKAFHDAFGVQPGQPMRRPEEKRNEIWE